MSLFYVEIIVRNAAAVAMKGRDASVYLTVAFTTPQFLNRNGVKDCRSRATEEQSSVAKL